MAVIAQDDFNRSDSSTLGSDWLNSGDANFGISGNKAVLDTDDHGYSVWVPPLGISSANYEVEATIRIDGDLPNVAEAGVVARFQDENNHYIAEISTFNQTLFLGKYIGGNYFEIANYVGGGYSNNADYKIWLSLSGDQLQVYVEQVGITGRELKITATDNSFTTIGRAGIFAGRNTAQVDDFAVYGLPSTGPDLSLGGVNIVNSGDIPWWSRMVIQGAISGTVVTNLSTGDQFYINRDIPAGHSLEIRVDADGLRILLDGITNWRQYLIGDFFKLQQGTNLIRLSGTNIDGNALLSVYFRNPYLTLAA